MTEIFCYFGGSPLFGVPPPFFEMCGSATDFLLPVIAVSFLRSSGVKHMTDEYVSYVSHWESLRHSVMELSVPRHTKDFPTRIGSNVLPYAEQQIALPSTNPNSRHTIRADMSLKSRSQIRLHVSL
jgi:hypothetical protein